MNRPKTTLHASGGAIVIGEIPRVVGTLSSIPEDYIPLSHEVPSDIVEIRLDETSIPENWINHCLSIEASGLPVILTVRLNSEGGKWNGSDEDRLQIFEQALQNLSCIDIELQSKISTQVSKLAKRFEKACIVSYHDFQQTPSLAKLKSVVAKAQELASIVKISTMVKTEKDVETLQNLLLVKCDVPLCVIGMGALGAHTRVSFASLGSCMTYAYLDKPSAPGQLPASNLVQHLRSLFPKYNEEYIVRKQVLEYA